VSDVDIAAIRGLVEAGRVHRRVYTDPAVFELEMERIFGRTWLYVGHESQIPKPGDYFATELGRQPVIMARHVDGSIRILSNRCTHRGAKLVNVTTGNVTHFSCLYHGWSFDTAGRLVSVPVAEGCSARFDKDCFSLAAVPRVGIYRGFVFASLARDGVSFEQHIGPVKASIDDLVDRAPDGRLSLDLGVHRYHYNGNWKLQVENVLDSYHVPFSHASTVNKDGVQFARREGDSTGAKVMDDARKSKSTSAAWKERRSYVAGNGHGWTSNTQLNDSGRSSAAFNAYKDALTARVGAQRAAEILTPRLHNTLIYPNLSVMGLNIHVRVIKPVAVDRTEILVYPVRLAGAPDAMNFANLRFLNVTHSAASFVQTDDVEAFVRCQRGLQSRGSEWVDLSRGLGVEEHDTASQVTRELATHEMAVRAQYKAWVSYMTAEAA
jgi:benzoate/toluate 1,2-dioxygenase subunit alpha